MKKGYLLGFLALVIFSCSTAQKKTSNSDQNSSVSQASAPVSQSAHMGSTSSDAATIEKKLVCRLNEEERKLEVRKKATGCELVYTKLGKSKSVATSANGSGYCLKAADKIKGKLASAGYQCQ